MILDGFTPSDILSNDAWFQFTAVIVAILLFSLERPKTLLGKRLLLPLWCIALSVAGFGSLMFLVNRWYNVGRWIVFFEAVALVLVPPLILVAQLLMQWSGLRRLRQGNIHDGIDARDYFA